MARHAVSLAVVLVSCVPESHQTFGLLAALAPANPNPSPKYAGAGGPAQVRSTLASYLGPDESTKGGNKDASPPVTKCACENETIPVTSGALPLVTLRDAPPANKPKPPPTVSSGGSPEDKEKTPQAPKGKTLPPPVTSGEPPKPKKVPSKTPDKDVPPPVTSGGAGNKTVNSAQGSLPPPDTKKEESDGDSEEESGGDSDGDSKDSDGDSKDSDEDSKDSDGDSKQDTNEEKTTVADAAPSANNSTETTEASAAVAITATGGHSLVLALIAVGTTLIL